MWILLTLCLALGPQAVAAPKKAPAAAASQTGAAQPFARAWRYETGALTGLKAAADAGIVVVPLADGRVVALNPADGNLLWSADPGGQVSAPPLVTTNVVYVATSREGGASQGVLRALDRGTGLVVWIREMARPIVSEMTLYDGRIYCGSSDNSLYALKADTGAAVWAFPTRGPVRGQIAFYGSALLVGSDDGALYAVDKDSGSELWRYQTGGPVVGRAATSGTKVFVTSGDGSAYAIDATTRRVIWRSRTGAAIEAGPLVVDDDSVLIASYDNFVYLLDLKTGDRLWKRRLRGRLISDPITEGARAIVAPLRDDRLTVLALKDGNKLAAFALDPGDELVGPPTLAGDLLLLPTDSGLLAARSVHEK